MHSHATVELAEQTSVDKLLAEGVGRIVLSIDKDAAMEEARSVLQAIREYDANLASFEDCPAPVVIVRLSRAVVYIVVLPKGFILTGTMAVRIVESLLPYLERIADSKRKPVLVFFTRKGKLTLAGYLYLGSVIENHNVGVLFVNGDYDEVMEILWHLENAGKYEAPEDDIVDLARLKE